MTKDLDKYDMILQAFEYEAADRSRGRFLEDFFASTKVRQRRRFSDGHFYLPEFRLLPHFLLAWPALA